MIKDPRQRVAHPGYGRWIVGVIACVPAWQSVLASAPVLANLSLEQLSKITIVTAARHSESLADTAAAVTVLHNDDIIRSGASSVPEALRWVPGLEVAKINAADWAITSRGFNNQFSNKLLVMMDGRSVYTPLFSGVYWDAISPILDDLDRIEVVRGSGASLWGANAVNGVINILSKSARDTQGGLLFGGAGTEDKATLGARYGWGMTDQAWGRVYAHYHLNDASRLTTGDPAIDGWQQLQSGFRFDWQTTPDSQATLQGDYFHGVRDRAEPLVDATGVSTLLEDTHTSGANILGRWRHDFSAASQVTLQSYYDRTRRVSALLAETRDTLDLDAQHQIDVGTRHSLIWGIGYRRSSDQLSGSPSSTFVPGSDTFQTFTAFFQDEATLEPDRVKLTVGSKLEHNNITGFEWQPDVRLLWTPAPHQTYWTSVSRAIRTPNRDDISVRFDAYYVPPGPNGSNPSALPVLVRAIGSPDLQSETELAYQAGWRIQYSDALSIDATGFYSNYQNLIVGIPDNAATFIETVPAPIHLVTPVPLVNGAKAHSDGGEVVFTWQPNAYLRLMPSYSYLHVKVVQTKAGPPSPISLGDSTPRHQVALRASMDATRYLNLDVNLRWVDQLPGQVVPSYAEADLRLAWSLADDLELAIVGKNLLHDHHNEFGPQTIEPRYDIERSVNAKLLWRY